jgi:two-component system sensor histidine kinase KdpD
MDAAEFFVVHVDLDEDLQDEEKRSLAANIRFGENLGGRIIHLNGKDIAKSVAAFAREYKITQIIFGRSAVRGWQQYLYLNAIQRFLRNAPAVDVHIVNQEER